MFPKQQEVATYVYDGWETQQILDIDMPINTTIAFYWFYNRWREVCGYFQHPQLNGETSFGTKMELESVSRIDRWFPSYFCFKEKNKFQSSFWLKRFKDLESVKQTIQWYELNREVSKLTAFTAQIRCYKQNRNMNRRLSTCHVFHSHAIKYKVSMIWWLIC